MLLALAGGMGLALIYLGLTEQRSGRRGPRREASDARWQPLLGSVVLGVILVLGTNQILWAAPGVLSVWFLDARRTSRERRRRRSAAEAWPEALDHMIASLRSGSTIGEACSTYAARAPVALREGFECFAASYRSTGLLTPALAQLRTEVREPTTDRVVASLSLAHEVGGSDLVRSLQALSGFVRKDLAIRKEIEARWSWTITGARVAAAAPWLVLLMMSTRQEALDAYTTSNGTRVIVVGAVLTACGYRLMLRAARLPENRRLV